MNRNECKDQACREKTCQSANKSISCTVTQCVHHCKSEGFCSLSRISIGAHAADPTEASLVDCRSFRPSSQG